MAAPSGTGKPPKARKARADALAHARGLAESREQAKRLVMAGQVFVRRGGGLERVAKPGQPLPEDAELVLRGGQRFVSRGGEKLLTAIEAFPELRAAIPGCVALDAGASTGGFTDCLLQHGAAKVYAVDVGTHQLHEKLRADARVVSRENVNLRVAGPELIPEPVDLVVADVSFISLTLVLPPCLQWLRPGGLAAALVKPQFELGPGRTDRGVVRDEAARQEAVAAVLEHAASLGLAHLGTAPSRIKGPKGNQEFLVLLRRDG